MSAPQPPRQVQEFAEEVFDMSKMIWAVQSRSKARHQTEITETEFLALDILHKARHTLTVGDIQRQIGVLPAQMSRIIRALEGKSDGPLINCRINPADKRKIDVELTPAGHAAHEAYRHIKLGTIERILGGLTENDRLEFIRLLRLIRDEFPKHPNTNNL